jgi:anti-sigma B factor antagonist
MEEPTAHGPVEQPVAGVDRVDGAAVVHLSGELDLHNAAEVRKTLLAVADEAPTRLVVDLADVEFIDSTALGVLVEARSRFADRGTFLLASPGLETHRALQISGLDRHLSVHETVAAALRAPI